jgi:hypothetical protein
MALGVENPLAISAATRENVTLLIQRMFAEIDTLPEEIPVTEEMPVYTLPEEDAIPFSIEQMGTGEYRVVGKRIERAAAMTYWDAGVQEGDTVYIGDHELEWSD